jgi:hypothetical protein
MSRRNQVRRELARERKRARKEKAAGPVDPDMLLPEGELALLAGAQGEFVGCALSDSWQARRLARVALARAADDDARVVLYLEVDLGCRGPILLCVHSCEDPAAWNALLDELRRGDTMVEVESGEAVHIVLEGLRYSSRLGFRPHPAIREALTFMRGIEPRPGAEPVPLGEDDLPLYIPREGDDVEALEALLRQRFGRRGYRIRQADG